MLTQSGKVISFASKALSSVERCSSQIEREALAVSWGYHHLRMYLLGSHFKVITGPQVPVALLQQAYFSFFSKNWQLKSEIAVISLRSAVLKIWFKSSWLHIKTSSGYHSVWPGYCVCRALRELCHDTSHTKVIKQKWHCYGYITRCDFTRSDALTSNGQWNSLYPVNGVDPSTP